MNEDGKRQIKKKKESFLPWARDVHLILTFSDHEVSEDHRANTLLSFLLVLTSFIQQYEKHIQA